MDDKSPLLLPRISQRMAAVSAVLLAVVEVCIDWTTDIDLNVAIIYGLPLVVVAAARGRRLLWGLTAFLGIYDLRRLLRANAARSHFA